VSITRADRSEEFGRECNSQLCSTTYLITPKRAESMGRGRWQYPKTMNSHRIFIITSCRSFIVYGVHVSPLGQATHALAERLVSRRGAGSSAQRFETRDERSDTRSDDGIHMSYYGINSSPNEGGFMARLKRSKKAGSPPSPVRGFKVPKTAKRTESAPDMRANRRLSQSRAKPIAGHIRATTKRRQAKRDSR
jgi:hypothetical protein